MKRQRIRHLLASDTSLGTVTVMGWVRTRRSNKDFSFIELNDGSSLKNLQIVANSDLPNYDTIGHLTTGSSIKVTGEMIESQGKGQKWEVKATEFSVFQEAPEDYPLQKKRHSDEFLRTIAHLRPRTNKYGAIFRIRSAVSHAIHEFFATRDFHYIHTPILTGSDCEGAGEMFQVVASSDTDEKRFFGQPVNLTVSGQLAVEMFALSLGDVYTFGPTFRAENSNTSRHASEFWMIEPEMAFCDLEGNMEIAEALLKHIVTEITTKCADDLALFANFVDKGLMDRLCLIRDEEFVRLSYTEAIEVLEKADANFEYPVSFGIDLQSEHERYITESVFKKPVILYNYPKTIKPFYMRLNDDDKTVAAMDVLVPGIGEIIGGSQREERFEILKGRMDEMNLPEEEYGWYLDSRKYGSVPHSGFGLGFERVLMLVTGVANIRDVVPFPRTPGSIQF